MSALGFTVSPINAADNGTGQSAGESSGSNQQLTIPSVTNGQQFDIDQIRAIVIAMNPEMGSLAEKQGFVGTSTRAARPSYFPYQSDSANGSESASYDAKNMSAGELLGYTVEQGIERARDRVAAYQTTDLQVSANDGNLVAGSKVFNEIASQFANGSETEKRIARTRPRDVMSVESGTSSATLAYNFVDGFWKVAFDAQAAANEHDFNVPNLDYYDAIVEQTLNSKQLGVRTASELVAAGVAIRLEDRLLILRETSVPVGDQTRMVLNWYVFRLRKVVYDVDHVAQTVSSIDEYVFDQKLPFGTVASELLINRSSEAAALHMKANLMTANLVVSAVLVPVGAAEAAGIATTHGFSRLTGVVIFGAAEVATQHYGVPTPFNTASILGFRRIGKAFVFSRKGIASSSSGKDIPPIHEALKISQAEKILAEEGLVDLSKYEIIPVSTSRLKGVQAPQGPVHAVASVDISTRPVRGGHYQEIVIPRKDGKIPIKVDRRLLSNLPELRNSIRHEVAETEYLLEFVGKIYSPADMHRILIEGHQIGLAAEIH